MAMYRVSLKHHAHKGTSKAASGAEHAAYILRDIQTPETKSYVEYVLRQSRKTQDREDLAHAEWHNLPAWADDKPISFFLAAERFEGGNRRVSSSLEVALPRELPREAQIALMQDYCASQFGKHPYLVGLHDSTGASGEQNPHFHVTWSARIADGIERPAHEYFRRPPHGAGKDPMFRKEAWLIATRHTWADLANVYLEKHGIEHAFVDARSLKHRGIERAPEPRLSPDHTTKAKLGKGTTPEWQEVLQERQQREAFKAFEQAIATDAWKERKAELGITDVHRLDREAFVQQIAERTREYALHPPQPPTREQLRIQTALLQRAIASHERHLQQVSQERRMLSQRLREGKAVPAHVLKRIARLLGQGGPDAGVPRKAITRHHHREDEREYGRDDGLSLER
jgi:hypothetical protein